MHVEHPKIRAFPGTIVHLETQTLVVLKQLVPFELHILAYLPKCVHRTSQILVLLKKVVHFESQVFCVPGKLVHFESQVLCFFSWQICTRWVPNYVYVFLGNSCTLRPTSLISSSSLQSWCALSRKAYFLSRLSTLGAVCTLPNYICPHVVTDGMRQT